MKASVIIPTLMRTDFLDTAMDSVVSQDFPKTEYELLVVDNAPTETDSVKAVCANTVLPAVNYVHQPNNGLHNARHAGAKTATGAILVYIDDDVICPPNWLGAILEPFENPKVALVGGKVNLYYEDCRPAWLSNFKACLSHFDRGNAPHAMSPYHSVVGCNMAVRKDTLFEVGGFNPDGFRDRRLLCYRGDGENGLARKLHDAGYTVWYAPAAWVHHRVPASRMTLEYIKKRMANSGIESTYCTYRYRLQHPIQLTALAPRLVGKSIFNLVRMYCSSKESNMWFRSCVASVFYWYGFLQCTRLIFSRYLRTHTKAGTYL